MAKDNINSTDTLIEGVRLRFKGDKSPATIEMISEIWIELLLLHDMIGDLTKLISSGYNDDEKIKTFGELASNLQKSISQIANNLSDLPAKSASADHEQ